LGAEGEAVSETGFEVSQGEVGGIGLGLLTGQTARGVELPDEGGIAVPGLGSADVLDAMAGPEAVGGAEGGQAALGADAGAGEDEDAVGVGYVDGVMHMGQIIVEGELSGAPVENSSKSVNILIDSDAICAIWSTGRQELSLSINEMFDT